MHTQGIGSHKIHECCYRVYYTYDNELSPKFAYSLMLTVMIANTLVPLIIESCVDELEFAAILISFFSPLMIIYSLAFHWKIHSSNKKDDCSSMTLIWSPEVYLSCKFFSVFRAFSHTIRFRSFQFHHLRS